MGIVYSSTVRGFGPNKVCWRLARSRGFMMQEMQEDFYLVLFMFASQLYFYVLGPSSLLGY